MATRTQFRHEDVATVPRGWKVRTVTQRTGHQARIAFPPGPRRKGAGQLVSILHPQGENPGACREGGRLKAEGSNPRGKPDVPAALDSDPQQRRYYRMGYRDGLKGFATMITTRKYFEPYNAGWDAGFAASGRTETRPFEKGSANPPRGQKGDIYRDKIFAEIRQWAKTHKVDFGKETPESKSRFVDEYARQREYGQSSDKSGRLGLQAMWGAQRANPRGKIKTREQVEKMQAKAVKFLRDVVKDDDKADEIEALSLDDYAAKKKVTLANPRERTGAWQDVEFRGIPKAARLPGGSLRGMPPSKKRKAKKPRNPKRRRRNQPQDAKALYRKFHGKAPKEVLELQESAAIRGEYASLGDLVELVVKSPAGDSLRIGFEGEKVKLASSPNGGQLYFLGGNQALDGTLSRFKTDATKDLVDLGEAQSIVYRAAKDFTGFKSSDWEHAFGEESGERPSAFYDKLKRRIFLVGGTYRVERPGIVD